MEDTHLLLQTFTLHPKTQIETPLCPFDTIYCTEMDIKNKILYILLVVLEMLLTQIFMSRIHHKDVFPHIQLEKKGEKIQSN